MKAFDMVRLASKIGFNRFTLKSINTPYIYIDCMPSEYFEVTSPFYNIPVKRFSHHTNAFEDKILCMYV